MPETLLQTLPRLPQDDETWGVSVRLGRFWLPGENGPVRPHILLVIDGNGQVLVQNIQPRPFRVEQVWQSLAEAMTGAGRRPGALSFDQPDLLNSLADRLEAIGVSSRGQLAPEIMERALVSFEFSQSPAALLPPALVKVPGITERLLGRLFALCGELYRLAPWKSLPGELPLEVRYPETGASRWVVVLGSGGEAFGLTVTDSLADLRRLTAPGDPLELARQVCWLALSFDSPEYMAFEDLDAISEHGWTVVNELAYPAIYRLGGPQADLSAPSLEDVLWLEGVLAALLSFFHEPPAWRQPRRSRVAVETQTGPAWVEIIFPGLESG